MKLNKIERLKLLKWDAMLRSRAMYEEAIADQVTEHDIPTLLDIISQLYDDLEAIHDLVFDEERLAN